MIMIEEYYPECVYGEKEIQQDCEKEGAFKNKFHSITP